MWVNDVIQDVANRLRWDDGDTIPSKAQSKIIRGVRRLFDRFSIDGRKLPVVNQIELTITRHDAHQTFGPGQSLDTWAAPNVIHHASWKHRADCGCTSYCACEDHRSYAGVSLCNESVRVETNDHFFFDGFQCVDSYMGRPERLFYQRQNGEAVFSSRPRVGDVLVIRATMPFDVRIFDSCASSASIAPARGPEWEFDLSPSHCLDERTRQSILSEARATFNCDPNWCLTVKAQACGTPASVIDVVVTARKIANNNQSPIDFDSPPLPPGYYDSLVRILTWDLAPEASIKRNEEMRADRNEAVKILHRANMRAAPNERDLTTYWSPRFYCDSYEEPYGHLPRGHVG